MWNSKPALRMFYGVIILSFFGYALAEKKVYLLDQYAPTPEDLAEWEASYQKLVIFSETPEFIGRELTQQDKNVRRYLVDDCAIESIHACQSYIKANRQKILQALPDNPLYWERFWDVVKQENIVSIQAGVENRFVEHSILQPPNYWFYRQLASTGRIEREKSIQLRNAIRNWRRGHQTQAMRMVTAAIEGMGVRHVSFVLAQASRDRDERPLQELGELLQPPLPIDMSHGATFWLEREFTRQRIQHEISKGSHDKEEIEALLAITTDPIQANFLKSWLTDPVEATDRDWDLLAERFIPQSTMSWEDQWKSGLKSIEHNEPEQHSIDASVANVYLSYIQAERSMNFSYFLYPALVDIYSGRASPGPPARPAPSLWRWDWRDSEKTELCLISENRKVLESLDFGANATHAEFCVEYFDEEAVEALYAD